MPLADRGPGTAGFLLLRRQGGDGHAVLRLSQPDRLPAGGPPPGTAGGSLRVRQPAPVRRRRIGFIRRRKPTEGGCCYASDGLFSDSEAAPLRSHGECRTDRARLYCLPALPDAAPASCCGRSPWTSSARIVATPPASSNG